MPGMYAEGDYDLAGFCVGIVERERVIDAAAVAPGQVLLALASSGVHSNGYSLVRRILAASGSRLEDPLPGGGGASIGELLLAPTRIYVAAVHALLARLPVRGIAHITGGGLTENVARILPAGARAVLRRETWRPPPVFGWLGEAGGVAAAEMERTFNCGAGMVIALDAEHEAQARSLLAAADETVWRIGEIAPRAPDAPAVELTGAHPDRAG
jgi:phosphoribosylformylglycinamidine cyclo-ligase